MTPERLQELVLEGDLDELAAELAPLSEEERKSLSKTAYSLHSQIRTGKLPTDAPKGLARVVTQVQKAFRQARMPNTYAASQLAVLGVCPLSRTRSLNLWLPYDYRGDALVKILTGRRPEWIDAWLEHQLDREFTGLSWPTVRTLVQTGVCRRPKSDGYARLMATGIRRWHRPGEMAVLSRELLRDPELLQDEIWRLFEVETTAFTNEWMENSEHTPAGYESWSAALTKLADANHIDRGRLLDASLDALSSAMSPQHLSGFRKLHLRLEPTPDEIKAREAAYRDLLQSSAPHVAGFALQMLRALEKTNQLDAAPFLAAAASVSSLETKGPAASALKMAKRLATGDPTLADAAAHLSARALVHPNADVQQDALELLGWCRGNISEDTVAMASAHRDHLGAALRAKLDELFPEAARPEDGADQAEEPRLDDRIEAIDPSLRSMVGLAEATRAGRLPAPLEFDVIDVPVLGGLEPLPTIETLDELIDRVAHAVEVVDAPEELELILDGISRFCGERPESFASRTEALLERIQGQRAAEVVRGMTGGWAGIPVVLKDLLLTWLTGKPHRTKTFAWYIQPQPCYVLVKRIGEVTTRVSERRPAPLLATPTHRRGWIDARILVGRMRALEERALQPPDADLVQSLLRLAPDHRDEALASAQSLTGRQARCLRWALGEDERPERNDRVSYPMWIAAARARGPRACWREALSVLELEDALPDGLSPAEYSWRAAFRSHRFMQKTYLSPEIQLTAKPRGSDVALAGGPPDEPAPLSRGASKLLGAVVSTLSGKVKTSWRKVPTAALHRAPRHSWEAPDLGVAWLVQWVGLTWPLNADSTLAMGARSLAARLDENASSLTPNHAYLEPLFDRERPWTEMALLALWTALVSKDADARGLAVDALIEGIDDGRAHPDPMTAVLGKLAGGGWIKPNRLADVLREVSRASDLHALVVAMVLDGFLGALSEMPRSVHHVLELQWDLTVQLGIAPTDRARERYRTIGGSGKGAKLAKRLAQAEGSENRASADAGRAAMVARIERAERYQELWRS